MQILVILCHPLEGSFNHAVARRASAVLAAAGHEVRFHDLYKEGFDPVMPGSEYRRGVSFDEQVVRHTQELASSGGLVFVHPEWWGQPPSLLKGWLDRVLRPGVAYEPADAERAEPAPAPLLGGKSALVFATREQAARSGLLERVWMEGVFAFCGMSGSCHVLHDLRNLAPAGRIAWLELVAETLTRAFPASGPPD